MRTFAYVTVDVFTEVRFGGNPLAVFTDARGLSDAEMQQLAAELNYSETTFVLPPENPAHSARVRIFNRVQEMPFAGHPNVGTGCVLATMGRAPDGILRFEELAGLVTVRIGRDAAGRVTGAHIEAPQPLSLGAQLPVDVVAACFGSKTDDVLSHAHPPQLAAVGLPFCFVQVAPGALARATPDIAAFRRLVAHFDQPPERLSLHLYARGADPAQVQARMFAPLSGTWEDPATGSANAALGAMLLSLGEASALDLTVRQGEQMGRPSRLQVHAWRAADGIRARVGGGCVPVFAGTVQLD
jgi:trans-2,3-dihydro-3-hydroxyanthranilate isomerase